MGPVVAPHFGSRMMTWYKSWNIQPYPGALGVFLGVFPRIGPGINMPKPNTGAAFRVAGSIPAATNSWLPSPVVVTKQ